MASTLSRLRQRRGRTAQVVNFADGFQLGCESTTKLTGTKRCGPAWRTLPGSRACIGTGTKPTLTDCLLQGRSLPDSPPGAR